ncbi:MAG: aldehyde dehydrogenase family protein, partial [Parvibaculum sp.]
MDFSTAASPGPAAQAFLDRRVHRHLIGGEWVQSAGGAAFETLDPATGNPLAALARGTAEDVDAAVAAARAAFDDGRWSGLVPM